MIGFWIGLGAAFYNLAAYTSGKHDPGYLASMAFCLFCAGACLYMDRTKP